MSKLTRNLYDINCILNETRGTGCIITEEDMRYIEEIRLELTNLAGPEDIDVIKFIKAELNKNYGVVAFAGAMILGGTIGLTSVMLGRKLIKKLNSKKETQES